MGGRGSEIMRAKGGKRGLKFSNGLGKPSEHLFPAYMNRTHGTGSLETMTRNFSDKHSGSDIEYAVAVDERGYTRGYYKGNKGSVSMDPSELIGMHLVHNHPSEGWGNFSGADLESTALDKSTGITAVSRNVKTPSGSSKLMAKVYHNRRAGTYQFRKTQHFNRHAFISAIHNLQVRDTNYDKDLDKWLRGNQKKYGYRYSYTPARNKPD